MSYIQIKCKYLRAFIKPQLRPHIEIDISQGRYEELKPVQPTGTQGSTYGSDTSSVSRQVWAHGRSKITIEIGVSNFSTVAWERSCRIETWSGVMWDLPRCYTWLLYRWSEMANYSNDLGLSRLILRDPMFYFDAGKLIETKPVLIWNMVAIGPVCEEKCRIMSLSDDNSSLTQTTCD